MDLFVSSSASFRDRLDALALFVHCLVLSKGWVCTSLKDELLEERKSLATVPKGWNSNADVYMFQYAPQDQSDPRRALIKIMRMDPSLICYCSMFESAQSTSPTGSSCLELDSTKHVDSEHLADHNEKTVVDAPTVSKIIETGLLVRLAEVPKRAKSDLSASSASQPQSVLIDDRRGREVSRPHPDLGACPPGLDSDDDHDFDPLRIGRPHRSLH